MTVINIRPKNPSEGVAYRPFGINEAEDRVLFMANILKEEVMRGSEKQQYKNVKKLKKFLKTSLSALGAGAGMSTRAFAATTTAIGATNPLTPAIVMKWGITIALIAVAAGVALSMIMLAVAGIYRMFRKRDIATEWTTDIVKGLVQVLIAVPVVYVIYVLAQMLFSNLTILKALF